MAVDYGEDFQHLPIWRSLHSSSWHIELFHARIVRTANVLFGVAWNRERTEEFYIQWRVVTVILHSITCHEEAPARSVPRLPISSAATLVFEEGNRVGRDSRSRTISPTAMNLYGVSAAKHGMEPSGLISDMFFFPHLAHQSESELAANEMVGRRVWQARRNS
jgi:hypothetical protein